MNDSARVPRALGIIMDGNRRFAREQGISPLEGHKLGLEKIKEVLKWSQDAGIQELTVYAFSTENWGRSAEEVGYLMKLIEFAFDAWIQEVIDSHVRIRCIGERERLPSTIQNKISEIEERTQEYKNGMLVFALSYGGRAEILAAVNRVLESGREVVTESELREAMWSAGLHDPDLLIRTGGDHRLSNFLTWQSIYSEIFFTPTKWPAFSQDEFTSIIKEFSTREQRRGV